MKPFFNRIDQNMEEFIKIEKQHKNPNAKGNVPMDLENLLELITYCVNNGFEKVVEKPKP